MHLNTSKSYANFRGRDSKFEPAMPGEKRSLKPKMSIFLSDHQLWSLDASNFVAL